MCDRHGFGDGTWLWSDCDDDAGSYTGRYAWRDGDRQIRWHTDRTAPNWLKRLHAEVTGKGGGRDADWT